MEQGGSAGGAAVSRVLLAGTERNEAEHEKSRPARDLTGKMRVIDKMETRHEVRCVARVYPLGRNISQREMVAVRSSWGGTSEMLGVGGSGAAASSKNHKPV